MDGVETLPAPQAQAELPAPGAKPAGDKKSEALIDPELLSQSIDKAYSDATNLVLSLYSTKEDIVTQFLKNKSGQELEPSVVQDEIKKRQTILDKDPALKTALDLIVKAKATGMAADRAVVAASAGKPLEQYGRIREEVIARYYNRATGIYYEVGEDGKPLEAKREIRLSLTVEPIVDALEQIKSQKKPDKPDESTPEAQRAENLFMLLKDRMYSSNDGGFVIDHSVKKSKIEAAEFKKAKEEAVNLGWETLDAYLKRVGSEGIRNGKGDIDLLRVSELVKKLDPQNLTSLGRLTIFLIAHAKCSDPTLANKFFPTLIYQELTQLVHGEFASQNPHLGSEMKKLQASEVLDLYKTTDNPLKPKKLNPSQKDFDALIKFTVSEAGFDPEVRRLPEDQFTKILTMAFLVEDEVESDYQGRVYIKESKPKKGGPSLKEIFNQMELKGALTAFEKQLILTLAAKKTAGKIFQALGFTPELLEKMKGKDCGQYFADEAISFLKGRLGEQLPELKADEYKAIMLEILNQGMTHYDKKFNLSGWFKTLGLLAVILGPSWFSIFNEGVGVETEPQRGR